MVASHSGSNPFSTGGGGTNFEQKVGTVYLGFLLARQIPYGSDGIVKAVKFQQLHTEQLDDLVVITEHGNKERKLSLQLKHKINFRESDEKFTTIIGDCWRTLADQTIGNFDPELDRFGVGLGIYQQKIDDYRYVIKIARTSENSGDFFNKLNSLHIATTKKEFVELLKTTITTIKGSQPTEDELWKFLKCFEILHFDLENDDSKDVVNSWNNLLGLLQQRDPTIATSLFDHLFSIVSNYNPSAGAITYQQLRTECSSFPLIENPDYREDIKQLNSFSDSALKLIHDVIAEDIHFDRLAELENIITEINNNEILVLHGEPLVGKSVLIKMLANELQQDGECIVFPVDRLENGSLQSFLHQLNITNNFESILSAFRNVTKKVIFIDGLEHTTDENKRRIVNEILIVVREYNEKIKSFNGDSSLYWKIVCSSRTLDVDRILLSLETRDSIQNNTLKKLEIKGLSSEEKSSVVKKKPNLESLINKDRLQELFSRPGILDLACRRNFPTENEILEQINSESQFVAVFWQYVIRRNNELVSGRGTPLARESLVSNMATKSLLNNEKIRHDSNIDCESFAGLESDRIIQKMNNSIYFVYDYLEDWAWVFLLKNGFDETFNKIRDKVDSLRIISSFRLFSQFLLEVEKNPKEWMRILTSLDPKTISPRWESEWVASPLSSPNFESILPSISNYLIKNESELFTKLLKALRLVSVTYDFESISKLTLKQDAVIRLLSAFTLPIYEKWGLVIKFTLSNFQQVKGKSLLEFSKICKIWMDKTKATYPLRREIVEKCLELSSTYLRYDLERNKHDLAYDDEEEFRKNLVYSIFNAADLIPDKVDAFLRFHIMSRHSGKYHRIDEHILEGGWIPICRDLPTTFVDIMTRILCHSLKPDRFGWSSRELGINHDMEWFVPSPILDPFYIFLRLHNEEGLRLIHNIVNHSTLAWRIREREKCPVVQTLEIDNKILNLWGDERVYRWYRFPSLGSHAVCCALMALEKWLDESIKSENDTHDLFIKILSSTNCVAVVGVCCSVLLANPAKVDNSILVPILENPVFWLMDESRRNFDLGEGRSLVNDGFLFLQNPNYMNFHKKWAEQPHRESWLSYLTPSVLLSENEKLKKRLVDKMKNFENNVPILYKKPNDILDPLTPEERFVHTKGECRLWSLYADIKNYRKITHDGETGYFLYPPDHFTKEDEEKTTKAEEEIHLYSYRTWAYRFLVNNEIRPVLTIEKAISYAMELEKTLKDRDGFFFSLGLDFITNLAAALIVRKWDFIVEKNLVEWCETKIIEAGKIQIRESEIGVNREAFDRAVAYCTPFWYKQTRKKSVKELMESFACHRVNEVRHILFYNLQILWDDEPKVVWNCINNLIKISTNGKTLKSYDHNEVHAGVLFSSLFSIPKDKKLIELKESKKIIKLINELLDFTINSYHDYQEEDKEYNQWDHFEWNKIFFEILANAILHNDEKFRSESINKMMKNWEEIPAMLEEFLRQFLLVSLNANLDHISQPIWHKLCNDLLQSEDFVRLYARYYKKEIVGILIFEDPFVKNSWKSESNSWLEKHIPIIQTWCEKFGTNDEHFPSLVKLLNSIGFGLVYEYGINWLVSIFKKISDKNRFLKESRISSELDLLLWKTWKTYEQRIKQDSGMLNHFSFLIDIVASMERPHSMSLQKILEQIKS